jgi:hypothetical protein
MDNVWDCTKLNHDKKDDPTNQKMEVLKLINIITSTALEYVFEVNQNYTFAEMNAISLEAIMNLKTHLMKTLMIKIWHPPTKNLYWLKNLHSNKILADHRFWKHG